MHTLLHTHTITIISTKADLKKYSAELESLSDDLQSKIEEYSSVKKEKDQEYFLRKKIERRMNERHGSDNGEQYVTLANRTSPLSPTAFGCD